MVRALTAVVYIIIFLIGASFFSFFNVVIYRVPRKLDFVKGRSLCPACGHNLKGSDMIPMLSWLLSGGKCRYCKARISVRYALVELFGGLLAIGCIMNYGDRLQALVVFAFFSILTVIAIVDMDTMEIPNGFVIGLLTVSAVSIVVFPDIRFMQRVIGMAAVSLPLLIIAMLVPGAFGGGDIKLMAASGLFLGWKLNLIALFLAIISGGGYGIYLLAAKKKGRKEHFAFGPFLCVGMAVSFLWGERLFCWYLNLFF